MKARALQSMVCALCVVAATPVGAERAQSQESAHPPQVQSTIGNHDHDHDQRAPLPAGSESAQACRTGAFVEASAVLNSTMEITDALAFDAANKIRTQIDNLLYTALKQAHSEVHCVKGVLRHGYHRSFLQIIERATLMAKVRGLNADVVELGEQTAQALSDSHSD